MPVDEVLIRKPKCVVQCAIPRKHLWGLRKTLPTQRAGELTALIRESSTLTAKAVPQAKGWVRYSSVSGSSSSSWSRNWTFESFTERGGNTAELETGAVKRQQPNTPTHTHTETPTHLRVQGCILLFLFVHLFIFACVEIWIWQRTGKSQVCKVLNPGF